MTRSRKLTRRRRWRRAKVKKGKIRRKHENNE